MFETSESYEMTASYTYTSGYIISNISMDKEQDIIKMVCSGNTDDWKSSSQSYLKKIVGIY